LEETIMIKPRIIVTGATGKTGSVVVSELLKAGYPVRAMVHREDARSARLKAQGAEIAVADMSDVERVADALKDVQRAYYCPPFDPYMIQGAAAFAVAAKEAHVEHIVSLTQWLASPSHPALMTRQLWLVDRLFSMIPGVAHTIVRPGFFADAYLTTIGLAVHLGVFPWMYGNSRNAPPSNEDVARVAVAALIDPGRHAGKSYRPTGPELLGVEEMAKAIGRAVGRSVRVVPTPTWLFMKTARMGGLPIDLMSGVRYYIDDHKRGTFELGAPTTDVLDVTGRPPRSSRRSLVAMRRCPATSGPSAIGFASLCSSCSPRSAPASISIATTANCGVRSRRGRSLRRTPRFGGANTPSLTPE
jgi:NAD(P)H dehydrogenase (quinone)